MCVHVWAEAFLPSTFNWLIFWHNVVPEDLCFTSVTNLFIFFVSLLALRSHNMEMDSSCVCYSGLGVWCNVNIALHFGEKHTSLSLPFRHAGLIPISFQIVAHFTVVHQMAPLPSGLCTAVENDVLAAIFSCYSYTCLRVAR